MNATETIYTCGDGTPFAVRWHEPGDAALPWMWNQSHFPAPLAPLIAEAWRLGNAGSRRAFAEADVPRPPFFDRPLYPHGFQYLRMAPAVPDDPAEQEQRAARLRERCGGALAVWEAFCLPRCRQACDELQRAPGGMPFAQLAETFGYAFDMTHVASGAGIRPGFEAMVRFLRETGEAEAEMLTFELTQGFANATLDVDEALWALTRVVDAAPGVRAALLGAREDELEATIRGAADAGPFVAAFDRLLADYGWRCEGWDSIEPTWRERPAAPLAIVRRLLASDAPSPAAATRAAAERRERSAGEIAGRLSPERAAAFRALLPGLEPYVRVREGRALWQMIAAGSLRGALLRRGSLLVAAGLLDQPEDVFFLTPEEFDAGLDGDADLRPAVAERRADWESWTRRTPPTAIGAPLPAPVRAEPAPAPAEDALVLRGIAASRGTVTARARVARTLAEAERLEPGEVLVCVMTTPAWTPLFGIAGAIVTDSGGILSHPSIAAREYGIPCVVGTRTGTRDIPDGSLVTVDGAGGMVRIEATA